MFSKKTRVPRDQIKKAISEGQKSYSELFLIKKIKNGLSFNRFSVVVSKKISKMAFERNIVKRKIRSIICSFNKDVLNENISPIKIKGNDFVFILNPKVVQKDQKEVMEELKRKVRFMIE